MCLRRVREIVKLVSISKKKKMEHCWARCFTPNEPHLANLIRLGVEAETQRDRILLPLQTWQAVDGKRYILHRVAYAQRFLQEHAGSELDLYELQSASGEMLLTIREAPSDAQHWAVHVCRGSQTILLKDSPSFAMLLRVCQSGLKILPQETVFEADALAYADLCVT